MNHERNCLSNWFPRLEAAGIPVPRTRIVRWPGEKWGLAAIVDDPNSPDLPEWESFLAELRAAAEAVTGNLTDPVFLRTGQGSGKHDWRRTCHVGDRTKIGHHVCALVEWSHTVSFMSLPHDVWAVREMLPVRPVSRLERYGDMPLVRELRCFVEGGKVACHHDYWPPGAIRQGMMDDRSEARVEAVVSGSRLSPAEAVPALELAARVAGVFAGDGAWSVDVLETERGWFVTDMATAGESYHWEGCPNEHRKWEVIANG